MLFSSLALAKIVMLSTAPQRAAPQLLRSLLISRTTVHGRGSCNALKLATRCHAFIPASLRYGAACIIIWYAPTWLGGPGHRSSGSARPHRCCDDNLQSRRYCVRGQQDTMQQIYQYRLDACVGLAAIVLPLFHPLPAACIQLKRLSSQTLPALSFTQCNSEVHGCKRPDNS
jgi:hypothetical protein